TGAKGRLIAPERPENSCKSHRPGNQKEKQRNEPWQESGRFDLRVMFGQRAKQKWIGHVRDRPMLPVQQCASPGDGVMHFSEFADKSLRADGTVRNFALAFDEYFVLQNCRRTYDRLVADPDIAANPARGPQLRIR